MALCRRLEKHVTTQLRKKEEECCQTRSLDGRLSGEGRPF